MACQAIHRPLCFSTFKKTQIQKKFVVKSFGLSRVQECESYFIGIDEGEFETCDHVEEISLVEDKCIRSSTSSMTFDVGFMENYEILWSPVAAENTEHFGIFQCWC